MTERFTNHDDTILDTDGEQLISTDEIVDKMNELHEENEERKRAMRIAEHYNKQLENENKKLKKYIDSIRKGGLE